MKQHISQVGANYHYLILKQCMNEVNKNSSEIQQLIAHHIEPQNVIQLGKDPIDEQKKVFSYLLDKIKKTEWGAKLMRDIKQRILNQSKQLYEFGSQRNYFLIQNFRESTNYPIVTSQPQSCFNLLPLYKKCANKQLRRVIWLKSLVTEKNKEQFFKHDHKVSPYNIVDELTIALNRLTMQNQIKIKQNQKDMALRLLQYCLKKWNRIPIRSQQYFSLTVIDLFSHYTPSKMHQIGAVFVGLIQMAEYYFQENVQQRIQNIYTAFELIDAQTFNLIKNSYANGNQKKLEIQLNQSFEHFRMTMTCAFLPLIGSQYLIDQLLIKKRNKFDIYSLFVIMVMIMSDDLEDFKTAKLDLTEILSPERTKKTIKLEDVVDAFKVIYENVPANHVGDNLPDANKLLDQLLRYDKIEEQNKNNLQPLQNTDDLAGFVKEENREVLRLSSHKLKL